MTGGYGSDIFQVFFKKGQPNTGGAVTVNDYAEGEDKIRLAQINPGGTFEGTIALDVVGDDTQTLVDGELVATVKGNTTLTLQDIELSVYKSHSAAVSDVGKSLPSITSPNVPVEGTKEADELIGKDADDTISVKEGNDTVSLGDGDDVLNIFNLGDVAEHHGVNDTIDGGAGNDKIYELSGADSIIGGDGNDTIGTVDLHKSTTSDAENAHDTVEAGDGDDVLIADRGDVLTGGKGKDSFKIVVDSGGDGVTKITDCEKGDTIKLWRQAPEGGSFSAFITTNESGGNTEIRVDGVLVAIVEGATGLNVNDI